MADAAVIELANERCSLGVGTVILDDDLEVLVRLRDRCGQGVPECVRASQCGNDDRESLHLEGLMPIFSWLMKLLAKRQSRLEGPPVPLH